ncbi:MAG: hypothetical protein VB035_14590 [Candidatus Fimivivens sp.]|nr:hypothetical protein [Candidatus Fimivivens sp.]
MSELQVGKKSLKLINVLAYESNSNNLQDSTIAEKMKNYIKANGISVEARIQYDKVTYFNYVAEKLGFKIK